MKTNKILMTLLALFLLMGGAGCNRENPTGEIQIKDFSFLGCKEETTGFTKSAESPEYIEYEALAGGYLHLRHVNAVFNCCPGRIKADVSVEGNTISIVESETDPQCKCICDYDLDFNLGPLSNNKDYTLIFSRYKRELVRFTIKYSPSLEGKVDIKRFK